MNKLMTGVLSAGLAIAGLTGCSGSSGTASPSPSPSAVSPSASAAPEASTPAQTPAETPSSSAAKPAGGVDQSTPEAAMTSWINALVDGRGEDICALTAFNGKRISDVANGEEQCKKNLAPIGDTLKSAGSILKGLTIKGATVKGDNASFEKAKTTPELASGIVGGFKAVKIDGKWYVTTG